MNETEWIVKYKKESDEINIYKVTETIEEVGGGIFGLKEKKRRKLEEMSTWTAEEFFLAEEAESRIGDQPGSEITEAGKRFPINVHLAVWYLLKFGREGKVRIFPSGKREISFGKKEIETVEREEEVRLNCLGKSRS